MFFNSIYSLNRLNFILESLNHKNFFDKKIFLFYGSLGVGKTSFIKQMATFLGSKNQTNSPTYTYVNSYGLKDNKKLHHFDLYRIRSIEELESIGFFEYLNEVNSMICIEWPEIIEPYLNTIPHFKIDIDYVENIKKRSIKII